MMQESEIYFDFFLLVFDCLEETLQKSDFKNQYFPKLSILLQYPHECIP